MRLVRVIGAALAGAVLLATQALAADTVAVRTMMQKSGIVAQYQDLGEQMRAGMLKSPPPMLAPDVASMMATIVGNTMDGGQLLDQVQKVLADSLSDDDVTAMNRFFDSDLGGRIVKAEIAAAAPARQDEITAKAQELLATAQKDPDRLAVIERIDKTLHTSELSARATESLIRAMSNAMAEAGPAAPDPHKLAEANARIDAMHGSLVRQMHDVVVATAESVYQEFSTAEMKTYADFLESDPSQIMYATFNGIMKRFYAETGRKIGEELAAAVRQQKT